MEKLESFTDYELRKSCDTKINLYEPKVTTKYKVKSE